MPSTPTVVPGEPYILPPKTYFRVIRLNGRGDPYITDIEAHAVVMVEEYPAVMFKTIIGFDPKTGPNVRTDRIINGYEEVFNLGNAHLMN